MDENKIKTDEEVLTPEPNQEVKPENPSGQLSEKTFTQEQVDKIVQDRLSHKQKSFYKALGVTDEDEFNSFVEKGKKYDELEQSNKQLTEEVNGFKEKETERGYKAQLSNVDDEFTDVVFLKVAPMENEKVEDYKTRVEAYLEEHPKLKKGAIVGTIGSTPNLKGEQGDALSQKLREAMKLPSK